MLRNINLTPGQRAIMMAMQQAGVDPSAGGNQGGLGYA